MAANKSFSDMPEIPASGDQADPIRENPFVKVADQPASSFSIDADGAKTGYELNLTRLIVDAVTIPVIASGGAGSPQHMVDAVTVAGASAALIASIVHYGEYTIRECKEYMAAHGAPVRLDW